jgi:hypothetical protein
MSLMSKRFSFKTGNDCGLLEEISRWRETGPCDFLLVQPS